MFQKDEKCLVRRELIPFVLTLSLQAGQEAGLQGAEHLEAGEEHCDGEDSHFWSKTRAGNVFDNSSLK